MTKKRDVQFSLRYYFTLLFITIFLVTSIVATVIVLVLKGILPFSSHTILWFLIYNLLVLALGCLIMWKGSVHLTKPFTDLNQVVKQVSNGFYDQQVIRKEYPRDTAPYHNEIDQLSQNINKMTEDLKNADHLRQQFIANLSHELKTPVASLVGISDLLLDKDLEASTLMELAELLQSESLRLSRLCDDILNLTKMGKHFEPKLQAVKIDEQLRQALILITEKWPQKTINLTFDSKAITCQTDPDLSMQIWINLIENAVKYSKNPVAINILMETNEEQLIVSISDNGIGISEEDQRHLFEQFYQADSSHSQEGSGLGLAIVKSILTLLNGSIKINSSLNKGTSMIVTLPLNN